MWLRLFLFWNCAQCVFGNRRFGIASVSSSNVEQSKKNNHLTLIEGKINSPQTSLTKHEPITHSIAEQQRSHMLSGSSYWFLVWQSTCTSIDKMLFIRPTYLLCRLFGKLQCLQKPSAPAEDFSACRNLQCPLKTSMPAETFSACRRLQCLQKTSVPAETFSACRNLQCLQNTSVPAEDFRV